MGSSWGLALRDAARAFAARRGREEGEDEAAVDEAGFTLIELMVVLLIMGILMAIAIPTFLGAASGAHDKSSQSDVTNALTSAKSTYASNGKYTATATEVTNLKASEPEMKFSATTTASTKSTQISIKVTGTNLLILASYSPTTKNCWLGADNEGTTTATVSTKKIAPGINYAVKKGVAAAGCVPTVTPTGNATGATAAWKRSWPKG